jgi:hypothetical protein
MAVSSVRGVGLTSLLLIWYNPMGWEEQPAQRAKSISRLAYTGQSLPTELVTARASAHRGLRPSSDPRAAIAALVLDVVSDE